MLQTSEVLELTLCFRWQTLTLTEGKAGSRRDTHQVVLSGGAASVTSLSELLTQDEEEAGATNKTPGEESGQHCVGQEATPNPLKHTPPGFSNSSSKPEAALMQA